MDGMDQMVHPHPGQTTTMGTFVQIINTAITTHFTINIANTTPLPTDHHTIFTNQKVATVLAQYTATHQLFKTSALDIQMDIQVPFQADIPTAIQADIQTLLAYPNTSSNTALTEDMFKQEENNS